MTDTATPENDADNFPPVSFAIRNPDGDDAEVTLTSTYLGLGPYVLLTPGDDRLELASSHLNATEVGQFLAIVLATLLTSPDLVDLDDAGPLVELLTDVLEERRA